MDQIFIYVRHKIGGRELHTGDDALHLFKVHEIAPKNCAQRKSMSNLHNDMPNWIVMWMGHKKLFCEWGTKYFVL